MPGLGFISSPFPDPARGLWSWFRYAPKTLSPFAGTISESVFGRWTVETLRGLSHPLWASLRHFLHRNVGSVRLNIDYWKNGRAACSRDYGLSVGEPYRSAILSPLDKLRRSSYSNLFNVKFNTQNANYKELSDLLWFRWNSIASPSLKNREPFINIYSD